MTSELARIAKLRALFAASSDAPGVEVAIGDDAAVLEGGLVWTVDAQVEGTHFRLDWVSWEDVGWRSFMAAASDVAAMGAEPLAALSSLALSPSVTDEELEALARGQAAAAAKVGAPVVGGNLARARETSITTTVLGRAARSVLRSGAREGDGLWLAGPVGLAAAGLRALESTRAELMHDARIACALAAWRRPTALVDAGRALGLVATAAIDVSDGLARDASHVAEASGVTLAIDEAALLAHGGSELAGAAAALGVDAVRLALHGGEDYALVATAPPGVSVPGFTRIGDVRPRGQAALLLVSAAGSTAIDASGFDHFAAPLAPTSS